MSAHVWRPKHRTPRMLRRLLCRIGRHAYEVVSSGPFTFGYIRCASCKAYR